ncbi:MAG: hypothetical protein J6S69_05100 [Proteobacteria bacterium]|nr:hypothetical protein [Pseudomonadota bacterium]
MGVYDRLDKYTQTALLQTALNVARDDVDKREGSILYDALAPLAFLAGKLIEVFKGIAEDSDIQTAQGDALDWTASHFGIYRTEHFKCRLAGQMKCHRIAQSYGIIP